MNDVHCYPLYVSKDAKEFRFFSVGPKGRIPIIVEFNQIDHFDEYNLSFGNLMSTGRIDDYIRNDNKYRDKILATVAKAVYVFTNRYPEKLIFFKGSTPSRTRLYRMALTNNFIALNQDFDIFGMYEVKSGLFRERFVKGKEYHGFVVKRIC